MIELSLTEYDEVNALMLISNIIAWVTTTLSNEKGVDATLDGYVVLRDKNQRFSALLVCEKTSQEKMMKILQQPPNAYKEKYIACIVQDEPSIIEDKEDEKTEGKDRNVTFKIEET